MTMNKCERIIDPDTIKVPQEHEFVMPDRDQIQVYEDTSDKPTNIVLKQEIGFAILHNRRVLLANL